jgi:hypothetical protein
MAAAGSRLAVLAVAVGILAATWLAGDHGAARATVGQATGPLVGSTLTDTAILSARDLRPGDAKTGEITVMNVGDQAGTFALTSGGIADAGVPLSGVLDLAVQDITPGRESAVVYSGKLGSLASVDLGTLAQGEVRRYRFTVALPADVGDAYQGASTTASFVWTASAVAGTPAPVAPAPPVPAPAPPHPAPPAEPRATLTVRARQRGARGTVSATVACSTTCRAMLGGTAADGRTKVRLTTLRWTLSKRTRVRIALARRARTALSRGRSVTVRLRLQATMGTRVAVARGTVVATRRAR